MIQKFVIPGKFVSLNEFYRANQWDQEDIKESSDDRVAWCAKAAKIKKCKKPIRYHVLWVEENRRRDLDNVAFAKKFIQDGLVKAGILHNDSHHEIIGFSDSFDYDSRNPRIEVTLEEVDNA